MDLTFISIHDLTPEARILYSSDSIVDVLGYTPDEIVNHSTWEYFPEEELPYARKIHKRGIAMDKAAVLAYCRIKNKQDMWVGCECCFTIVYDVMVVCTSIYRTGLESQKRAEDAPVIRRLFSSSPKDPRYHMLAHISDKFRQPRKSRRHEPRAALFLNRFTRTLTIMYATSGLEEVLGIPAEQMRGRSFYYCISENCLVDSVKCLENAKANDSIAYLRFWFRDPRQDDQTSEDEPDDSDEEMTTDTSVDQDVGGGVQLDGHGGSMDVEHRREANPRRTSNPQSTHEAVFGGARLAESPNSSLPLPPTGRSQSRQHSGNERSNGAIELEAVISCTSDGLVVCLRRARPLLPTRQNQYNENGIFAAPWATEPIVPPIAARPQPAYAHDFAPALSPHAPDHVRVGGPEQDDFMASIREQAIFAWALTGINGSLHKFGYGKPTGDSVPFDGLPVWESDPSISGEIDLIRNDSGPTGWDEMPKGRGGQARERDIFGDPGLDRDRQSASSGGSGSGS